MRSFGPKNRAPAPAPREPFEFTVLRDEDPETHTFNAVARTDAGALSWTLGHTDKHPERALSGMIRMISKMLDNKDGTPAQWRPTPLPRRNDPLDVDTEASPDESVSKFRGPDGKLYPLDQADQFTAHQFGSSRRRFLELMENDDDVIVDAADLGALFEYLVGLAAGRPTQPPS
jgi:hypothetical protein